MIIGSIYQPPNTKPKEFNIQYKSMLAKFTQEKKNIVLGMDHNLDLLKANTHIKTQSFSDLNFNNSIFPCIT